MNSKYLRYAYLACQILLLIACFLPFVRIGNMGFSLFDFMLQGYDGSFNLWGIILLLFPLGGIWFVFIPAKEDLKRISFWEAIGTEVFGLILFAVQLNEFEKVFGQVEVASGARLATWMFLLSGIISLLHWRRYGTKLHTAGTASEQQQETRGSFCTACGAPLKEGANFCERCGRPAK